MARSYYKRSRLQQLRGFCYAAETGSISKAAAQMLMSQPSVSLQVRALERDLGVVLFERKGPRIILTPQGEILKDMALPLVKGIDTLSERFAARCGSHDSGELSIAAGQSTILYLLPKIIECFAESYPRIQIRFYNVPGREGLNLLWDDTVDFAIGPMGESSEDVVFYRLWDFEEMLIVPLGHPLAERATLKLEDISDYPFILPPRHLNTLDMVALAFRQRGKNLNVRIEAGGWEIIKRFVEMGMGISVVSGLCLTGGERLLARSLAQYFPNRSYGIVLRRGKFLSPQAKLFIDALSPGFRRLDEALPV